MRKSTVVIVSGLILVFLAFFLSLDFYKLELVNTVVVNAVIQKAADNYPEREIRQAFGAALDSAKREGREKSHLQTLLSLSQRLEKIQRLSLDEVREMLTTLDLES